ncbi:thiamine repressible regulatory protein thi1 [Purpureocillium lavendulum]|uniref:Thiamine repressible regulatory protein thi1 n=1 Tax=Purpureocillium lavendulum TaxID=1247861 RepID=A0AB34FV70_9HYPO|nr:thiamine repressible regulatory protein thi1 [Purpureocillium lavendulum]
MQSVDPEDDTSEMFMWPRFLSKLRDAFCLDPQQSAGEREISQAQACKSTSRAKSPDTVRRLHLVVQKFPPKAIARFLLSVCISHGTDVFYYFDQELFPLELDSFYDDPNSPLRSDPAFVALCLAVFALGSHWTSMAKPGSVTEPSDAPENPDPGRIFYDQARVLMGDILDRDCLRSVQAAYIFSVYLMPMRPGPAFIYGGLALRKAMAMGLHQEPDDLTLSEEEKEGRRRLFWSIWASERIATIKVNRARSVPQNVITARLPSQLAADARHKFNNVQHQIANAQLARIMDDFAQPAAWSSDETYIPPNDCDVSFKSWRASLPAELRIALGKVSVVTTVRLKLRAALLQTANEPAVDERVEALARSCVKAAYKMLSLFEVLYKTTHLVKFSFTDFQGCSIATIVLVLGGILDRDTEYQRRVNFGLDCLRRMAGDNSFARRGVQFVEALRSIADEARTKLRQCQSQATPPAEVETTDYKPADYFRWAQWLATTENAHADKPVCEDEASHQDTLRGLESRGLQMQGSTEWAFGTPTSARIADLSASQEPDPYLPSVLFRDSQLYLTGLTEMDVLNFTNDLG